MLRSEPHLRKKIPLGVRIVAILNLISGFGLFLNIIVNLLIGGSYTSIFSPMSTSTESIIVDSLVVIPCLFVGFGFYGARRWSWTLAVILYSIDIGAILITIILSLESVTGLIRVVVPVIIVYYLSMSHVKEYFGKYKKAVIGV